CIGGNTNLAIEPVIRIHASVYANLTPSERYGGARGVGETVRASRVPTLLIGPGRWGTSSPDLGVPVRFSDIAGVAALVEVSEKSGEMVPDLSYGSHFFQDLVETGIAYAALFPETSQCQYRPDHLGQNPVRRRLPASPETAVQVHDFTGRHLQLTGDVVRQQLVCYFTD